MIRSEPWMKQAACKKKDPGLFFPNDYQNIDKARAVCVGCPVRKECGEYSFRDRDAFRHGIWDGTTPRQRDRIARRWRKEKKAEQEAVAWR